MVLADDAGRRELEIWLLSGDGHQIERLSDPAASGHASAGEGELARSAFELGGQLLRLVGVEVTAVGIDELGPDVTAARIELTGPAGTRHVTARLPEGLAVALATGAPLRVAGPVMDRLAVPARDDQPAPAPDAGPATGPVPAGPALVAAASGAAPTGPSRPRPRYEPRNLSFADGMDHWLFAGSFAEHASQSHWHDFTCTIEDGVAVISSTVPDPAGFAVLGQEVLAEDYRGATITFRGEFRADAPMGRAGLILRVNEGHAVRGPLVEADLLADPDNNVTPVPATRDWTPCEVTARVPDDTHAFVFGVFLADPGRLELRHAELTRSSIG